MEMLSETKNLILQATNLVKANFKLLESLKPEGPIEKENLTLD